MKKGFLVLVLFALMAVSGCGWHIPFFGDEKVEQDEPVVQETTQNAKEQPQYSGTAPAKQQSLPEQIAPQPQQNSQQYGARQAPYNAYNYGVQTTAPAATTQGYQNHYGGAGTSAQPYQQPAVPGSYGQAPTAGYGTGYGNNSYGNGSAYNTAAPMPGQYQQTPTATPGFISTSRMGSSFAFQGIKRKIIFIIHYPQRGLTTKPLDQFSQKIYGQLAAAPGILLLPKEAVSTYVSSHQLFIDSLETRTKLAKLGREMGAHVVILEKVNFLPPPQPGGEGNYQLSLEAVDVSSGYPLKTYTIQGNSYQSTPPIAQVISDLAGNLKVIDWYSRLIKVDGGRIFVNAGRLSGLQIGQKLRIYAKGSEVVDPATKMSLGKAPGVLKGIVKVADFFGMDGAICKIVSGKGFAIGDMVKAVE